MACEQANQSWVNRVSKGSRKVSRKAKRSGWGESGAEVPRKWVWSQTQASSQASTLIWLGALSKGKMLSSPNPTIWIVKIALRKKIRQLIDCT